MRSANFHRLAVSPNPCHHVPFDRALLKARSRDVTRTWFSLSHAHYVYKTRVLDVHRFADDPSAMMTKKSDDCDDDDGKNFFREVCSVDCPGSTGWLSARGTFTRWVLSRTRRWLLFLSLILSRARLFYPANLFKHAFNSARPYVPP